MSDMSLADWFKEITISKRLSKLNNRGRIAKVGWVSEADVGGVDLKTVEPSLSGQQLGIPIQIGNIL